MLAAVYGTILFYYSMLEETFTGDPPQKSKPFNIRRLHICLLFFSKAIFPSVSKRDELLRGGAEPSPAVDRTEPPSRPKAGELRTSGRRFGGDDGADLCVDRGGKWITQHVTLAAVRPAREASPTRVGAGQSRHRRSPAEPAARARVAPPHHLRR